MNLSTETLQTLINQGMDMMVHFGASILVAVVILIVGLRAATIIAKRLESQLLKNEFDASLAYFLAMATRIGIKILLVVAILNQLGFATASLLAVLGAAGLAIGLALQGTLSHVAAGIMLILFRPMNVGQYVEVGGVGGTVKHIGLMSTELATVQNVQIFVPNGNVWASTIKNYSHHNTRRVDLTVGIAYEDDIGMAMRVLQAMIDNEVRIKKDPKPQILVANLGESSVDIVMRLWTTSDDYWDVHFDMIKKTKEEFDSAGITIPYPQRVMRQL